MATPKKPAATPKQLVHLTLDTDNLDAQIAAFIGTRVEEVLNNQMGNIVAGELAKLKLTGKNSVIVAEIVQKQISAATKAEVRAIAEEHRPELHKAFTERLKAMANNIRF